MLNSFLTKFFSTRAINAAALAPCGSRPQLFDNMAMYSVAGSSTSNPNQVDRTALAYSPKTLPAFPSRHNWDLLWREACPPPGSSDHSQKVAAGKEETRK